MAVSMYLSEAELEGRFESLVDDFTSGFQIQPVARKAVMLICGGGKVAVLKKVNGEPALYLENREKEEELMLDISFTFRKEKMSLKLFNINISIPLQSITTMRSINPVLLIFLVFFNICCQDTSFELSAIVIGSDEKNTISTARKYFCRISRQIKNRAVL